MSAFNSYVGDSGPSFLSYLDGAGSGESSTAAAAAPPRELRVVSWNGGLRGLEKLCKPGAEATGPPDVHGIRRKQSYGSLAGVLGASTPRQSPQEVRWWLGARARGRARRLLGVVPR